MIVSAGMISAEDGNNWGLINQVVSLEELMPTCMKLASKIKRNSPMAIASAIRSVLAGYQEGKDGFRVEIEEFGKCFGTREFVEGTSAFMEKRKAEF